MQVAHVEALLYGPLTDEARVNLEAVPGVQVRGRYLRVPYHAVGLATARVEQAGIRIMSTRFVGEVPRSVPWPRVEQRLADQGEVRPEFLGQYPLPFQQDALSFCAPRWGSLLHHPTGAGKTYQEILWGLATPGPVLVATKGSVREQYARAVRKYSVVEPFVLKPATLIRKKDRWKALPEYLEFCQDTRVRPFVIVGLDSLDVLKASLSQVPFHAFVIDEVHRVKSWRRWEQIPLPALDKETDQVRELVAQAVARGAFIKEHPVTKKRMLTIPTENRAKATFDLARAIPRRLPASATLIEDRVRDLYAPCTYAEPDGWGSWSVWSDFYTDPKASPYNAKARITTGLSNADDLVSRLRHIMHSVPAAVVRAQLPDMRRETLYISLADQAPIPKEQAKKFHAELKAAQSSGARLEVEIAIGAARCIPMTVERMVEHLQAGDKVCMLTVRRWMSEAVIKAVAKELGKHSDIPLFLADGSPAQRDACVQGYAAAKAGAFLVGTGDALGTGTDDLQCTTVACFLGVPYSPGKLEQWEGRFPRLGQIAPLLVYYVVGESTALEFFAEKIIVKMPAVEYVASSGAITGVTQYLSGMGSEEAVAASILTKMDAMPDDDGGTWLGL